MGKTYRENSSRKPKVHGKFFDKKKKDKHKHPKFKSPDLSPESNIDDIDGYNPSDIE